MSAMGKTLGTGITGAGPLDDRSNAALFRSRGREGGDGILTLPILEGLVVTPASVRTKRSSIPF